VETPHEGHVDVLEPVRNDEVEALGLHFSLS